MRSDAMILVFWVLSFKLSFSTSSFTFSKRLFSSSSLSAIRMVSSAYQRLLIFLLAILIPVCASSSPAFRIMYSAHTLNKQGDNIQPWCTPFPNWNQPMLPCQVLTVASWPAYRFIRRRVRWSRIRISKKFSVCCDTHSQRLSCSKQSKCFSGTLLLLREGNGTPLQYSCVENPMDGKAW